MCLLRIDLGARLFSLSLKSGKCILSPSRIQAKAVANILGPKGTLKILAYLGFVLVMGTVGHTREVNRNDRQDHFLFTSRVCPTVPMTKTKPK